MKKIIVLGLIGFAGFYFYQRQQAEKSAAEWRRNFERFDEKPKSNF